MGAANSDAKLYDDEIQAIAKAYPDQFRVDYALSREQKNKSGGESLGSIGHRSRVDNAFIFTAAVQQHLA